VLPNLNPIFDNPKLDRELRVTVREKFKDFCAPVIVDGNTNLFSWATDLIYNYFSGTMKVDDFHNQGHPVMMDCSPSVPSHPPTHTHMHDEEPAFSDDEDEDVPLGSVLNRHYKHKYSYFNYLQPLK
jgi:hypothetical protein